MIRLSIIILLLLPACSQNLSIARATSFCSRVKLQVLGAGGPEINDGLASSSFLIWIDDKARVMVDLGGGSSFNFEKSGAEFNDLQAILLTHLHVDHSAALPVYIKAGYFTGRQESLPIFGPSQGGDFPSTEEFVKALFSDQQKSVYAYLSDNLTEQPSTDFLIEAKSVDPQNKIWSNNITNGLSIQAINVNHGAIPAVAWRVNIDDCAVTFSGDMNASSGNLAILAVGSNLLVANNAIPENTHPVAKKLHMTPTQIGIIANQAHVKKLLLAHFMLRSVKHKDESVMLIKKSYRGNVILADELSFISVD